MELTGYPSAKLAQDKEQADIYKRMKLHENYMMRLAARMGFYSLSV